jgi:DNA-binding XRE family transcriptional regulator
MLEKQFGLRLKAIREERGMTQTKLAEMVEVEDDGSVRRCTPSFIIIERIAKALGVRIAELFTFSDYPDL